MFLIKAFTLQLISIFGTCSKVFIGNTPYYADSEIVQLSGSSNSVEAFLNIPFSTDSEPNHLPRPVSYEIPHSLQTKNLDKILLNPKNQCFVCPEQGILSVPNRVKRFFDSRSCIQDPRRSNQLDIYRPLFESHPESKDNDKTESAQNDSVENFHSQESDMSNHRVIIYVHGGFLEAEARNSLIYNPINMLSYEEIGKNSILVAVEYSLGAFGFWAVDDPSESTFDEPLSQLPFDRPVSNRAIHDLIQALLWVQRYIKYFGGNSDNIILVGHSAGAALSNYIHLCLTERVWNGLYGFRAFPIRKMILMSSTALTFDAYTPQEAFAQQKLIYSQGGYLTVKATTLPTSIFKSPRDLRLASIRASAHWRPVVDNLIVMGKPSCLYESILAGITVQSGINTDLEVLLTITSDEARPFVFLFCETVLKEQMETLISFGQHKLYNRIMNGEDQNIHPDIFNRFETYCSDAICRIPCQVTFDAYQKLGIKAIQHELSFSVHQFVKFFAWRKIIELKLKLILEKGTIKGTLNLFAILLTSFMQKITKTILGLSVSDQIHFLSRLKFDPLWVFYINFRYMAPFLVSLPTKIIAASIELLIRETKMLRAFHILDQVLLLLPVLRPGVVTVEFAEMVPHEYRRKILKPIFHFIIQDLKDVSIYQTPKAINPVSRHLDVRNLFRLIPSRRFEYPYLNWFGELEKIIKNIKTPNLEKIIVLALVYHQRTNRVRETKNHGLSKTPSSRPMAILKRICSLIVTAISKMSECFENLNDAPGNIIFIPPIY